jgi:hypothetical protein
MSLYLLFETAFGYSLFEVNGYEEIQQKVKGSLLIQFRVTNSKPQ